MPKRKSRKSKKKNQVARRPYPWIKTIYNSKVSCLPMQLRTNLRYCDTYELDPAAFAGTAYYTWRANSIYDPLAAVGGNQPLGYDEIAPFYYKSTVIGSTITCRFVSTGAGVETSTMNCGVTLSSNATLISGVKAIREQPNTAYRFLSIRNAAGTAVVRKKCDVAKFFAAKSVQEDYDSYSEIMNSGGSSDFKDLYYHCWLEAVSTAVDLDNTIMYVQIDYDVLFSEPKQLAQSS